MSKHKKTNHDLMIDEEVIDVEFNDLFNNGDYDLEDISETDDILETEETEETIKVFVVVKDCERLNVRKFPNTNADILEVVIVGEELELIDDSIDGWTQVITSKNINGFVMSNYIKEI